MNRRTEKFVDAAAKDRVYDVFGEEDLLADGHSPDSMGELIFCLEYNDFLYGSVPYFFRWASGQLKRTRKKE